MRKGRKHNAMPENLKLVSSGRNRGFVWFLYSEFGKWLVEVVADNKAVSITASTETDALAIIRDLRMDYELGNF
jgi:hypothetical protein